MAMQTLSRVKIVKSHAKLHWALLGCRIYVGFRGGCCPLATYYSVGVFIFMVP